MEREGKGRVKCKLREQAKKEAGKARLPQILQLKRRN
jgi:hypothetical protein